MKQVLEFDLTLPTQISSVANSDWFDVSSDEYITVTFKRISGTSDYYNCYLNISTEDEILQSYPSGNPIHVDFKQKDYWFADKARIHLTRYSNASGEPSVFKVYVYKGKRKAPSVNNDFVITLNGTATQE